jgi:hypothetical protein
MLNAQADQPNAQEQEIADLDAENQRLQTTLAVQSVRSAELPNVWKS